MVVGKSTVPPNELPEMDLFRRLKAKGVDKLEYNSGMAFPGGGGRAYALALGAYKALNDIGLLKKARYTVCSSASCWATALYTYTPYSEDYFPRIVNPQNWTLEDVEGPTDKTEGYQTRNGRGLFKIASSFGFGLYITELTSEGPWPAWNDRHIFRYAGIDKDDLIAADKEHQEYLKKRLAGSKYKGNVVLPRGDNFPFWIAGATILGLKKLTPYHDPHSFQLMDSTALYVGPLHSHKEHYKSGTRYKSDVDEWTSGLVETMAFGNSYDKGDREWEKTLEHKESSVTGCLKVNVEKPARLLDMLSAASAAPAGFLSITTGGSIVMPYRNYVSINAQPPYDRRVHKWYFGDTGSSDNCPIYRLLQRKVKCALSFISPWSTLNIPWARRYVEDPDKAENNPIVNDVGPDVDWSLAAFFGVQMSNAEEKGCGSGRLGCTLANHQVFEKQHFRSLMQSFLNSHDDGKAMIHTMNLVTLQNDRFGIAAGHKVRVTFVYLSVPNKWEEDVLVAMRRIYKNPDWTWENDLKCKGKTFKEYYNQKLGFPSAPSLLSTFKSMCPLYATLFYQLAGNMVTDNKEVFKDALEHDTCHSESSEGEES